MHAVRELSPVLARLRPSDLCGERPLIATDRKWLAEAQNVASDPYRKSHQLH